MGKLLGVSTEPARFRYRAIGIELDEAVSESHLYNEKALHLEIAVKSIVGITALQSY